MRYTLFHYLFQLRNSIQILLRAHTGKQAVVGQRRMGRDIKTGIFYGIRPHGGVRDGGVIGENRG